MYKLSVKARRVVEDAEGRGSVLGLERMRELLHFLGDPQESLQFVHIAGTNGKGSLLAYVSTILKSAGYRCGRFYSPALAEPWDKVQINGKAVSGAALEEVLCLIADSGIEATIFEIETAVAFWYFHKKKCDIAVVECGLGGAGDATNVIPAPLVCAFTPISMDHMAILGKTIGEIAAVKAGIIKPGTVAVTAPQTAEGLAALTKAAEKSKVSLNVCGTPENVRYGLSSQSFSYGWMKGLKIHLAGCFQIINAALAVEVIFALRGKGLTISDEVLRKGLEDTVWSGRCTILRDKPLFLMDGAHNEAAARALADTLKACMPGKRFIMIMGVLKDKEYEKVLQLLSPYMEQLIVVAPPANPRALPAIELANAAIRFTDKVTTADSVEEAVEIAELLSAKKLPILATGSLSYLGRLEECVRAGGRRGKR